MGKFKLALLNSFMYNTAPIFILLICSILVVSMMRQKDFQSFHLENLFLACVTLICNGPEPFEQLLKRVI